jgi:homoserine O-acetyltransferase
MSSPKSYPTRPRRRPIVPIARPERDRSPRSTPDRWPVEDTTITLRDIPLESGEVLPRVQVRYRLEGTIAPARDNVVLVVHALTGTAEASDWWRGVIGADAPIDPTRHAVLCANLLGGCTGTTGPTVSAPDALPAISTRDQALVLARLLDALHVDAPLLVCGGSLGGMVTLEFAASFPARVRQAVVFAAPAAQTAQGIAWNAIMRRAITLGGPEEGLALARMVGMLSYRTAEGLERRFGRARGDDGRLQAESWLSAHGDKLVARFDAASYGALIDAMDRHDVGRGRGGLSRALAAIGPRLTAVGIPGDLLYPAEAVRAWAELCGARLELLTSVHGHDAFLLETTQVGRIVARAIATSEADATSHSVTSTAAPSVQPSRRVAVRETSARHLRIAVAGCGHVGGALLDLLGENALPPGTTASVSHVLVRDGARDRLAWRRAVGRSLATPYALTTDPGRLLTDDIDVLVEVIGGTTTAFDLVAGALRRGVRVVTANKALLAAHGPALAALARANGTTLDYEAAVGAAIPIVRALRERRAGPAPARVSGILNGTCNFVLDQLAGGADVATAIAAAQAAGYAEADPSRDLSGQDSEDKLRVLAWLAFGIDPAALEVTRRGLDDEVAAHAAEAGLAGERVRLVATCERQGDRLVASVAPVRVAADEAWGRVSGANNRIEVVGADGGRLVLEGPGAGGRVTAGAVLGDVLQPHRLV